MKNLTYIVPLSFVLAGCTLLPGTSSNITGTEAQKAEKLGQIISSGGQADCTVTNLTDKSTTQIIISGKKMKFIGSDFGEGKKGTMMTDDAYSYIWTEGEKTGFKTKLITETAPTPTVVGQQSEMSATEQTKSFEDETRFKTECVRRSILPSEFTPPAEVKFTDFSEIAPILPKK